MNTEAETQIEKWEKMVDQINIFTQNLFSDHEIFERYMEIVNSNKNIQKPSDFHVWVFMNYANSLASKIRSQLHHSGSTIKVLLNEIESHPEYITREKYASRYTPLLVGGINLNYGSHDFTSIAGDGDFFDVNIAINDKRELDKLGENIRQYVNKRVAHHVPNTKIKDIKMTDMKQFLVSFENIVKKYIMLFTGSSYQSLTPVRQYDWDGIFQEPWIERRGE